MALVVACRCSRRGFRRCTTGQWWRRSRPRSVRAPSIRIPNELLFYNPLNPAAARSNILQQTIDDLVLLRSLDVMRLDPTITNTMETVGVNPDRTLIVGQSQGAQTLPLVASLRPVSGILSGSGSAGFYNQFAYRSSSRGILGVFAPIDTLDITSPVVQLVEQLIDAGDPANYPTTTNFLNLAASG